MFSFKVFVIFLRFTVYLLFGNISLAFDSSEVSVIYLIKKKILSIKKYFQTSLELIEVIPFSCILSKLIKPPLCCITFYGQEE